MRKEQQGILARPASSSPAAPIICCGERQDTGQGNIIGPQGILAPTAAPPLQFHQLCWSLELGTLGVPAGHASEPLFTCPSSLL